MSEEVQVADPDGLQLEDFTEEDELRFRLAAVPKMWLTLRADVDEFSSEFRVDDEFDVRVAMDFIQRTFEGGILYRYYMKWPSGLSEGFAVVRDSEVVAAIQSKKMLWRPHPGARRSWILGNYVYYDSLPEQLTFKLDE